MPVTLCLFDAGGKRETAQLPLHGSEPGVWHGYLPGAAPGLVYGLRAHGPWEPAQGLRFNAAKLLLDPYAREVVGQFDWGDPHFGAQARRSRAGRHAGQRCACAQGAGSSTRPSTGATMRPRTYRPPTPCCTNCTCAASRAATRPSNRRCAAATPGWRIRRPSPTCSNWASPRVSLLPVHFALDEQRLAAQGLRNYWGYNTLAFFCPDPRLASRHGGRLAARRIPRHGARAAQGRHRGHAGRGVQPYGRRRRTRPHDQLSRPGQRRLLPPDATATGPATTTTAAAATRWTSASRRCCAWCWTACATGCRTCMSTAFASTWRRCWGAPTMASSATAPSSWRWRRTRCCAASS